MKLDRKGVIDLPIKLMVVSLILALSVPLVSGAMDAGEKDMAVATMNGEVDKIFGSASAVHFSGIGASRTINVTVPDRCEIKIGGDKGSAAYSAEMVYKSSSAGIRYTEKPPIRFMTDTLTVAGSVTMLMTAVMFENTPSVKIVIV